MKEGGEDEKKCAVIMGDGFDVGVLFSRTEWRFEKLFGVYVRQSKKAVCIYKPGEMHGVFRITDVLVNSDLASK